MVPHQRQQPTAREAAPKNARPSLDLLRARTNGTREVDERLARQPERALAFLAPGFLHKLGNSVFSMSSSFELLEAGRSTRAAFVNARTRTERALEVIHDISQALPAPHDRKPAVPVVPLSNATCVSSCVNALADLLPVRVHVERHVEPQIYAQVSRGALLVVLARTIEHLERRGRTIPGCVHLHLLRRTSEAPDRVHASFREEPGHLPFAEAEHPIDDGLVEYARCHGISVATEALDSDGTARDGVPAGAPSGQREITLALPSWEANGH